MVKIYRLVSVTLILLLIQVADSHVFGQVGSSFPNMECTNLDDKAVQLPIATQGKYTLVGIAYSRKAEENLKTWFKPVFYKFIFKPENPPLFYEPYDVNLYFIPMFTGVSQATQGAARNKMRSQVDQKLHPYVLLYKGELARYRDALAFSSKDIPYFFVLDAAGKIVYATSGAYSEAKMAKVEEILDDF